MRNEFMQRKATGKIWPAGRGIYGLCAAFNFATCPWRPMTEADHSRSRVYARAIRNRLTRLGWREGVHYKETYDGALAPCWYQPEHAEQWVAVHGVRS